MWLPHLADVARMTPVLSRHAATLGLPGAVDAVELIDVRLTHPHRPESPLCRGWATYLVTPCGAAPVQLYLKAFPDRATAEAAWREDRAARPTGSSASLPGEDLVVWRFPEDPRLVALPDLLDPRRVAGLLPPAVREVLGLAPGDSPRTTVVRYQPEASATLRLEAEYDGAPAVFAKHLADGTTAEVGARHRALWAAADRLRELRIAQPLAADRDRGVLWTRGVPGRPLAEAVPQDRLPAATRQVGALLAALHAAPVDTSARVGVDDLLAETHKKAAKLVRGHPAADSVVTDVVTAATRRRRDVVHERVRTLHGDFHLDQLVSSGPGPVLVDLDSLLAGAPEVDLAEFLVDLALRGLPRPVTREVAQGLLASYTTASGSAIDVALLAVCADAEFLNRCYRHLRRHSPGWESALEAELARHADVAALLPA